MFVDSKVAGNIMYVCSYATVYFINFSAYFTMEMVMVVLAGHFITSAFAGYFYDFEYAVFSEKLYTAVDCGYA